MSKNIENRTFKTSFKRMDGSEESRTVVGEATTFGVDYNMGWYIERIEAGAFDEALQNSDCRALFNHDNNLLLARQSSGTLKLEATPQALNYEFESPNTTTGNDILIMMERGDLKESSFAFTIKKQRWEEEQREDGEWIYTRVIEEVQELVDVSPVTFPANPDTSVAKRSFENWKEKEPTQKPSIPLSVREKELEL